jgi:hypothetical protein
MMLSRALTCTCSESCCGQWQTDAYSCRGNITTNRSLILTKTFPNDPDMFLINRILDKCVVEDSSHCLSSAQDLLLVIDALLAAIARGGQLLTPGVPRPCHVCGIGFYQSESLQQDKSLGNIRLWTGGSDYVNLSIQTFTCDSCGHVEFFKATSR